MEIAELMKQNEGKNNINIELKIKNWKEDSRHHWLHLLMEEKPWVANCKSKTKKKKKKIKRDHHQFTEV